METRVAPPGAKNAFGADIGGQTFLKPPKPGAGNSFATFLILCPTSFFLGILYSQFPYDYPILWAAPSVALAAASGSPTSDAAFDTALNSIENHMSILLASPPLIPRILHIVIGTGLLGFFIKLLRPTESNLLFDGASLALYVVGIVVYVTNIVKGMRMASVGTYAGPEDVARDLNHPFTPSYEGRGIGRSDSLRVLSASHTILALILMGILVLQAGQWYAERKDRQEIEKARRAAEEAARKRGTGGAAGSSHGGSGNTGAGGASGVQGKDKKRA